MRHHSWSGFVFAALLLVLGSVPLAHAAVTAVAGSPTAGVPTSTPASPQAIVESLNATLLTVMQDAKQLGFAGRKAKLMPVLEKAYNFPLMARLASGPAWRNSTPEQQQKIIAAFADFSVSTYANRFNGFGGERFVVKGTRPATGGGTIVESSLIKANGEAIALNYLLRADATGAPRILDVFLDGTISELATRRADFSALARSKGLDALIAHLEDKSRALAAGPTG